MEDSLIETDDRALERDSLSDDSFSKDSLLNGHLPEVHPPPQSASNVRRRGSYTLETSPQMSISIRDQNLTHRMQEQNYDSHRHSFATHNSSGSQKTTKMDMTQSLYERPWVSSNKNNAIAKAHAKQRDEKLRLAKEEQERKQKQKLVELSESERVAQKARKRKEEEAQRRLDEMRRKALERQKIVEERKDRLKQAEEARRKNILRKLVNVTGKKPSPHSSNNMMTMSCYGGFGGARTRPGIKEVVQNRVPNNKPLSSTGRIFGFGSSTPRPICANAAKSGGDSKKIPDSILIRCDILSRPLSSRLPDKMITSVINTPVATSASRPPQRQSSFRDRDGTKIGVRPSSAMATSMIDFSSKTKPKSHLTNKSVLKSEHDPSISGTYSNHSDDTRKLRPSSALTSSTKKDEDSRAQGPSKSMPVTKRVKKTKKETHIDSDSIEEDGPALSQSNLADRPPQDPIMERSITNNDSGRAPPTKDLSEAEYKARLMENRRLVREKREKEREEFIKLEREKRHAEELAVREIVEMGREKNNYVDESHCTTSNDDAGDGGQMEYKNYSPDEEDGQLSQITETPSITVDELLPVASSKNEEEKNERKKKLDSIMSRIRRPNEESSSDGGVSPRRAMSPEPAELEPDVSATTSAPAFKSSLLQSMMTKGRLSKVGPVTKESEETVAPVQGGEVGDMVPSLILASVRESIEDTESQPTHITSPSSVFIQGSGLDGDSLSDANSELVLEYPVDTNEGEHQDMDSTLSDVVDPDIEREDCDGKEDSLSINDFKNNRDNHSTFNDTKNCPSQSSTETEEEEMVKIPYEIDSLYAAANHNSVTQETCVFQN